jgi:hypothetical protein
MLPSVLEMAVYNFSHLALKNLFSVYAAYSEPYKRLKRSQSRVMVVFFFPKMLQ